jgi:transposase
MLKIRTVKTASGATAIQVVQYHGHHVQIVKHIGSAKTSDHVAVLTQRAQDFITTHLQQASLFSESRQKILFVERSQCVKISHRFARDFLLCCMDECELSNLTTLLRDLTVMRLLEPASKIRSVELLEQYFGVSYSQRFYRTIPKLIRYKSVIEQCAYKIATEQFKESLYAVFYDVTTLYFETFQADTLRVTGFSKDNKPQQPQIVVGLLVTQSGFPLTYDVFPGNTFEGKTMLPVIENFIKDHPQAKPVIVADAAMLSEERLNELSEKKFFYIVGARLANAPTELIQRIHDTLPKDDKANARFSSPYGSVVCDFSVKRYKKDFYEFNKLFEKAKELVASQTGGKTRTTFVKRISKESVVLNEPLIEKRRMLLGIKGYCTNIPEQQLSNDKVIEHYHNLWRIEQAFRMSKHDLQTRPVFHRKEDSIRSHVLICFTALMVEKYMELTTQLSLRDIRSLIWNITDVHIQDNLTKEIFVFQSPSQNILASSLAPFIKRWNLLPH